MQYAKKGSFTLPGEAGYEKLTCEMAVKWGADVIRDSDGTVLSDEIMEQGYGIYSTVCIIRDHNDWAKKNMDKLQQTFLMSCPIVAKEDYLVIHLLDGFFEEQFVINDCEEAIKYWQVFDRTTNKEISRYQWTYEKEAGNVVIQSITPFHEYTINFLAYRIWEEISMYNHVTNHWDKEHLMPIDPRSAKAREYLYNWLDEWCKDHPLTTVVRFTSMFYNFAWIWGSSKENQSLFSDWGSYDFTVSPQALKEFEKTYGYQLTSEDFINQGKFHVTHMPPSKKQLDYMEFTNRFVVDFGKKLVDLVHSYNKEAYVFYDDSWIGVEPYSDIFNEFELDGLIKCVFSGYEARLCSNVKVKTHELRLHPYLFPVGLGGAPTFSEGGNPTKDAKEYWYGIRRALLRQPVERIGLGGYLHLVESYPEFCDYIEHLTDEFRMIKQLHKEGTVYTVPCRVGILNSWGKIRSWSLSGHFHETYMHDLIHINEALAGLPLEVSFLDFNDIKSNKLQQYDVIINAGKAGTAWSGGSAWEDDEVITKLTEWVYEGGGFLGVNEPSAMEGYHTYFRMAQVLGVDKDTGAKVCHGKWKVRADNGNHIIPDGAVIKPLEGTMLISDKTKVLAEQDGLPTVTVNEFGSGKGIYLSSFHITNENSRMLLQLILLATNKTLNQEYITDNLNTELAYYPKYRTLVVVNNSDKAQVTSVLTPNGEETFSLNEYEMQIREI